MKDPHGNSFIVGRKVMVPMATPGVIVSVEKPAQLDPRRPQFERVVVMIQYDIPVNGPPLPLWVLAEPEDEKKVQ